MSKNTNKTKPRSGQARFPGIASQARDLGVSRTHLYLVLTKQRQSARLMAAWLKLNKSAA
ncbi:MAG: hypothetical protein H7067_07635 [Burkholderiales bacterium]|nr:hypothetical protein [Opitutaceae bacterium]